MIINRLVRLAFRGVDQMSQSDPPEQESIRAAYQETCNWYHKIDDFRAKLLGFLPFVSGTGVFLLLTDTISGAVDATILALLGVLGFAITLGLLFYELRGVQRCIRLRLVGQQLEAEMRLRDKGPFQQWPRSLLGINEPVAAAIIYPAVLSAWLTVTTHYLLIAKVHWLPYGTYAAALIAVLVYAVGLAAVLKFFRRVRDGRDVDTARATK
jgi:hypothetical protein